MNIYHKIILAILIVGGLNWGIYGLFNFDCVGWLFGGSTSLLSRIVFVLVGAAAVLGITGLFAADRTKGE